MYLIMSDVHGNLSALNAVLEAAMSKYFIDRIILLGDLIDYGMQSNEVISKIESLNSQIVVNIWGNHESAVINNDFSKFSSERGKKSAQNTMHHLSEESTNYIKSNMEKTPKEIFIGKKHCLLIHGDLADPLWGTIGTSVNVDEYAAYDIVFSGHSHIPHYFECFSKSNNEKMRYKKKTMFINPGSVGQPRNHNPFAQYAVYDSEIEAIHFESVEYDIAYEQSLFTKDVDEFYKTRLFYGV